MPALRTEDVVADREIRGVGAHRGDHTGSLVAAGEGVDADRHVTGGGVVVGVAQPGRGELDGDLVLTGVIEVDRHRLVPARCLPDDRRACRH